VQADIKDPPNLLKAFVKTPVASELGVVKYGCIKADVTPRPQESSRCRNKL